MSDPNPRITGLVRARVKQIEAANPDAGPFEFAALARAAAWRLCEQALKPGGKGATFDEALEIAALVCCWQEGGLGDETPNAETRQAMQDAREGRVTGNEGPGEMFEAMGIDNA